jgi:hypothetical protein
LAAFDSQGNITLLNGRRRASGRDIFSEHNPLPSDQLELDMYRDWPQNLNRVGGTAQLERKEMGQI